MDWILMTKELSEFQTVESVAKKIFPMFLYDFLVDLKEDMKADIPKDVLRELRTISEKEMLKLTRK